MVHNILWCFVMFRHGSSWFVMVRHGSRDGSWCFSVMVSWWFVMVCDVLLSWFRHGSSWFMMFYSLKFSRKGSCDPLFSQSEFQIHYQISFLMRLLIFPFHLKSIPLKSSAKNGLGTTRHDKFYLWTFPIRGIRTQMFQLTLGSASTSTNWASITSLKSIHSP